MHPDCIRLLGQDSLLLSFYNLDSDSTFSGGLGRYHYSLPQQALEQTQFLKTSAVFDFFLTSELIIGACVDRSLLVVERESLKPLKTINLEAKPIYVDVLG